MTIPDCVDRCTVARGTAPRFARLVLLVALILVPGLARAGTFHETFSTSQYKDGSATSADWNVGLGQLRLAPLNHASLGQLEALLVIRYPTLERSTCGARTRRTRTCSTGSCGPW